MNQGTTTLVEPGRSDEGRQPAGARWLLELALHLIDELVEVERHRQKGQAARDRDALVGAIAGEHEDAAVEGRERVEQLGRSRDVARDVDGDDVDRGGLLL